MRKNIGVILAAGSGSRFKNKELNLKVEESDLNLPKQYTLLNNKPIITYSLEVFNNHPLIDELVIVANLDYQSLLQNIIKEYNITKVKHIIAGGKNRFNSSHNAIKLYEKIFPHCNLIFHDAARPLVNEKLITDTILALKQYNAVGCVIDATDTIVEKNLIDNTIVNVPNRSLIAHCQTPQGFYLPAIAKAYEGGLKDEDFSPTDDCGVVLKYAKNEKIGIVEGDKNNIKVTIKSDLIYLQNILNYLNKSP